MARLMNYLLRLWLHCSDLSCDTGMFRTTLNKVQSSTCPLCSDDIESVYHLVVACTARWCVWLRFSNRQVLFDHATCIEYLNCPIVQAKI